MTQEQVEIEIDALGLLCPLPVLRVRKRARNLPAGTRLRILADDPAAAIDIPHWCAEAGHSFLGEIELTSRSPSAEGRRPRAYLVCLGGAPERR